MSDSENAHFRQIDLPQVSIPEDLELFSSSESESDAATIQTIASPPESPTAPSTPTPVTELGGGFSSFGFSDSEESPSTPKSRKNIFRNASQASLVDSFAPLLK